MDSHGSHVADHFSLKRSYKGLIACAIGAVFANTDLASEIFGDVTKPIVIGILGLLGVNGEDLGHSMIVAHLEIPWHRDCAGVNLALVLLAVFAWLHRTQVQDRKFWLKFSLLFTAALAANILRVFMLIGYRLILYPEVESPQMHYFLGYLSMIPFALLLLPHHTRAKKYLWFELIYTSSIFGLLSPLLILPGHWVTAIGVIVCLIQTKFVECIRRRALIASTLWLLLAAAIAWIGIESLWLPWLLACPILCRLRWISSPIGVACLATACPIFILIPSHELIAIGIFAAAFLVSHNKTEIKVFKTHAFQERVSLPIERATCVCLGAAMLFPFISSLLFLEKTEASEPPTEVWKMEITGAGYHIRTPEQPKHLSLLWYKPQGSDRHHALEVCLKYRGTILEQTEYADVQTDGDHWFREYFIVEGELIASHQDYLISTLGFRKNPGVHLIFVAQKAVIDAGEFNKDCIAVANELKSYIVRNDTAENSPIAQTF